MIEITVNDNRELISLNYVIGNQGDVGVNEFKIDIPRYYELIDLSTLDIYLCCRFQDGSTDKVLLKNPSIEPTVIIFYPIPVPSTFLSARGHVTIGISAENANGTIFWSSNPNKQFRVNETVITDGQIAQQYPTVIQVIRNAIGNLSTLLTFAKDNLVNAINEVFGLLSTHKSDKNNPHEVTKEQVQLGNVENTSDMDKPLSTAVISALSDKVDKDGDKVLSDENYTLPEKQKLDGLTQYTDAMAGAVVIGKLDVHNTDINAHENIISTAITTLANKSVVGAEGVHGLRYEDDKLQVWTGAGWEDTKTGAQIPLADCTDISIVVGNGQLTLKWKDPEDLVISGAVVAEWAHTKLVRKIGGYPTSETDGTIVLTSGVRNQYQSNGYVDTPLTNGTTYYYKLFPVSKDGAVTMGSGNNINATPQSYKTFGVSIDLTNFNSSTAVTYTDDAVGMTPGSTAWESQPIFKDIKPCMLKNGVVQYYLNPANFAQKADGSAADITSGNDGDVMIEFPKTGFQINTIGNTLTVKITDDPAKAGFKYYAHTRVTEGDRNKLYIGAYKGSNVSSKLRSLSGKAPHANETIGQFRTKAQANGAGYDQFAFYPMTLIQCLFLVRFKSLDSQTALGAGYTNGSAAQTTGATNANGMFYGTTSDTSRVKCFGLEDLWGNVCDWIDGLFSDANRNILTAFQNFNDTGSGYTDHGQGATSNIGSYMSKPQGTSERGFIAKEVSGSGSTYFADGAHLDAGYLPYFGGDWSYGSYAGVFFLRVSYSASDPSAYVGGRLMYL